MLISNQADANALTNDNETPLHYAVRQGRYETIIYHTLVLYMYIVHFVSWSVLERN